MILCHCGFSENGRRSSTFGRQEDNQVSTKLYSDGLLQRLLQWVLYSYFRQVKTLIHLNILGLTFHFKSLLQNYINSGSVKLGVPVLVKYPFIRLQRRPYNMFFLASTTFSISILFIIFIFRNFLELVRQFFCGFYWTFCQLLHLRRISSVTAGLEPGVWHIF